MGLQRKSDPPPIINAFKLKTKVNDGTEKLICVKTSDMDRFNKKWDLCMGSVP